MYCIFFCFYICLNKEKYFHTHLGVAGRSLETGFAYSGKEKIEGRQDLNF